MPTSKEKPGYTPPGKLEGTSLEVFSHNIHLLLRQNGGKLDLGHFPFQVPEIDDTLPTHNGKFTSEAIVQRAKALKSRFPTVQSIQEYILSLKAETDKRLSMETTSVKCPDCEKQNLVHFTTEHATAGFEMSYCYCPHCAGGLRLTRGY